HPPTSATLPLSLHDALPISALAVSLGVVTAALAVVNRASIQSLDGASPIEVVLPVSFALVGGLVAAHHPRNPIGWIFLFTAVDRSEEHTSELQSRGHLVCRL